jgi:hypothetical protein
MENFTEFLKEILQFLEERKQGLRWVVEAERSSLHQHEKYNQGNPLLPTTGMIDNLGLQINEIEQFIDKLRKKLKEDN